MNSNTMDFLQTEKQKLIEDIKKEIEIIKQYNSDILQTSYNKEKRMGKLQKVLIANRGEIAKRFFLSLKEESIPSVAVVTEPDRGQTWYEIADEVIFIGDGMKYVSIPTIIAAAIISHSNSIYPGYGFLSENPDFVDAIKIASEYFQKEIIFMGPDSSIMRKVGNKLDARNLAKKYGIPIFEGTDAIPSIEIAKKEAERIGYPVIVKLNAGGGGKGMHAVFKEEDLEPAIESCKRIGKNLYNDDSFYLEKFIVNPVHIEVQIFNGLAVGIRKCAVQRRNQKIIEETGDSFLSNYTRLSLLASAENMARISGYSEGGGAGTVEFLYDPDSDSYGFLEVNTRLQVEHPVTDQTLGIDLAKWQILFFDGREYEIPYTKVLERRFINQEHTIECRVYAEDPEKNYSPTPGKIHDLDLPTFNGIRCDFGFRKGDKILPDYDPMIGKIIAWGSSRKEAILRMERALNELYIRGVTSNLNQLLRIIRSQEFRKGDYSNRILIDHPELAFPEMTGDLLLKAAVFGATVELNKVIQDKVNELFQIRDLEEVIHKSELTKIPESFDVELYTKKYNIKFIQTNLEEFFVYANNIYLGNIKILSRLSFEEDYTFRFQNTSYSVRVDRRPSQIIVRMNDEYGKTHYYQMKITAIGESGKKDPPGLIRSPIQGTFVKFYEGINIGTKVKRNQPIIVLSAMKMESTIVSPYDGTIVYLIEEGNLQKLELMRTAEGKVIGKPISEGEVLFYVKPDISDENIDSKTEYTSIDFYKYRISESNGCEYLFDDNFEEKILANIDNCFPLLLKIIELSFLGYNLEHSNLINKINKILKELPAKYDLSKIFSEKIFLQVISTFGDVKKIFSPVLVTNASFFRETYRLFANWDNFSFQPHPQYSISIGNVFKKYNISNWRTLSEDSDKISRKAWYYIFRSFHSTREYSFAIITILDLIETFKKPSNSLKNILRKLLNQEEAEERLNIATKISEVLNKMGISRWNIELNYWVSRKYLTDLRKITSDPLYYNHISREEVQKNLEESLKIYNENLIPDNLSPEIKNLLIEKIEILKQKYQIRRLYSPYSNILIYEFSSKNEKFYFVYGIANKIIPNYDKDGNLIGSENIEKINIDAIRVLNSYQSINRLIGNYIEIIIYDEDLVLDIPSRNPKIFNYNVLMKMTFRLIPFFNDPAIRQNIISINCKTPFSEKIVHKKFYVSQRDKRVNLNILTNENPLSPYFIENSVDEKTKHIFNLGKWTVDLWVQECLDNDGKSREILIPNIDIIDGTLQKVGSKIVYGNINRSPAILYLKDSRISGGATGDKEGLKYVIACWLAVAYGVPLYVFNDGAGANIKEGMVSLNRAAEGFFMNALIGAKYSPKKIFRYLELHDDKKLIELVNIINSQEKIHLEDLPEENNSFIVAVGVGSSTGLDVYGSSQAAIQIMIDDEQSYRVLTGAAVIKSVTGEDLTNYEIGGGRIMNRITGTVDILAKNQLHLLAIIRSLHELFAKREKYEFIKRNLKEKEAELNIDEVLNYNVIYSQLDENSFIPFKEDYFGAGALITGFAKIAGRPILIMGPRNRYGLRSFQTLTKAYESLIIARKLKTDQIIILGDEWSRESPQTDAHTLRVRQDFLKLMSQKSKTRIHITTSIKGLQKVILHNGADALIFIKKEEYNDKQIKFIRNTATHIVHSFKEAFDISLKIIQLLSEKEESSTVLIPEKKPEIPSNPTQPFDILENVILRVFDENSFLEWWKESNDPQKGPSLITGFAKINGKTVGIIADQPTILGGAPDAPGTEKFRVFTELVERNQIPLVMISNAPGFLPGVKQERLRIQQIGGKSLDVNVLSTIPVISVTLNQNYGGRQIHAFSKYLRPAIISFSLKSSIMAVMGGDSAFDLFYGKKYYELKNQGKDDEAESLRSTFINEFNQKSRAENDAFRTDILDFMIDDVGELRDALIKSFRLAIEKAKIFKNI